MMTVIARAAGALALSLAAAGCSAGSGAVPCPHAAIVPELRSIAKFGPGPGRQDADVAYGAAMLRADVGCKMDKKKGGLVVSNKLGISALRARVDVKQAQITYFEAVVNRNQQILTEHDFVIDLEWPTTQQRLEVTEELETFVPLAKDASGSDYVILFGFRLTPDELQYNREHGPKPQG
jgi:hypothetical protein